MYCVCEICFDASLGLKGFKKNYRVTLLSPYSADHDFCHF